MPQVEPFTGLRSAGALRGICIWAAVPPALLLVSLAPHASRAQEPPSPIDVRLTMNQNILGPGGELWGQVELVHNELRLSNERPAGVVREPEYQGVPLYATFRAGNGPNSEYVVVLDEPISGDASDFRIYIDTNRNGDLTDDGDGQWGAIYQRGDYVRLGPLPITVRASWGGGVETMYGDYSYIFYRTGIPGEMPETLMMRRTTAREGVLPWEGREHRILLIENDSDALFAKPLGADGRPLSGHTTRPVHLVVDLNRNGLFERDEYFDARAPIRLFGHDFRPRIILDGSRLMLYPVELTGGTGETPRIERPALLATGVEAPDFEAILPDGETSRLSDYRGRVVILDFWATWCGPCQRAMPFVQALWESVREQGVVTLGICVWDERDSFDRWVEENKNTYTFVKAFDPAGRDTPNSIAAKQYLVTGIPTMYVIDREGRVVEGIMGFQGEHDRRLAEALRKSGITVPRAP